MPGRVEGADNVVGDRKIIMVAFSALANKIEGVQFEEVARQIDFPNYYYHLKLAHD